MFPITNEGTNLKCYFPFPHEIPINFSWITFAFLQRCPIYLVSDFVQVYYTHTHSWAHTILISVPNSNFEMCVCLLCFISLRIPEECRKQYDVCGIVDFFWTVLG